MVNTVHIPSSVYQLTSQTSEGQLADGCQDKLSASSYATDNEFLANFSSSKCRQEMSLAKSSIQCPAPVTTPMKGTLNCEYITPKVLLRFAFPIPAHGNDKS
jgi:hypothetical protein